MTKKLFWISGIIILAIALFLLVGNGKATAYENVNNYKGEMTIYKTGSCGCCGIYSGYFEKKGNSDVKVVNLQSIDALKKEKGIPPALESCHTTIIGDYFVEGHVPLEAIEKLLQEKPDIKGIAMPGMPDGSPGMPGTKKGDFVIYSVNNDGSYEEWMKI